MLFKQPVIAMAAAALFVAVGSAPVSAQQNCNSLYNSVMGAYQTIGPNSPQYAELAGYYNARCLSGSSMPNSPYSYQAPYAYPYQQPALDPGAAILGGVVGGILGQALDGGHRRRHDDNRWHHRGW